MKTTIRHAMSVGALAASLLGATSAAAQVTQAYCSPTGGGTTQGGFTQTDIYDPVTNPKGTLQVSQGLRADFVTATGTLLLTKGAIPATQDSFVHHIKQLNTTYTDPVTKKVRPFHTFFSFSIGPNLEPDSALGGMAFVAHNKDASAHGSNLEGLGYGGISKSFEIEFDTHKNPDVAGGYYNRDPDGNHIGFMLDGEPNEHPATITPPALATLTSTRFYVWIDYDGQDSRQLNLYFSTTKVKPKAPSPWDIHRDKYESAPADYVAFPDNFDMADRFSANPNMFVGFSAATALPAPNDHVVYEWEFSDQGIPCACQDAAVACKQGYPTTPACSAGPGTQNKGVCVECTPTAGGDGLCKAAGKVCDTGGSETCVDCNVNADCPAKSPICDAAKHTCGVCTTDADCKGHPETPLCALTGTQKGSCVECNQNTDCKSDKPLCSAATSTCVECSTSADCKATAPVCDTTKGTCNPCTTDADCKAYADTPACVLTGDNAGKCGSATKCDSAHPCPSGSVCDSASSMCVACTQGVDCPKDEGTDIIDGGGFSCSVLGASDKGAISGLLLGALGLAGAVARRRSRRSA